MLKGLKSLALALCLLPSIISANFDLDDFKGAFIFYGFSNSGIEFGDNPEFPLSQTNLSQVTFNSQGVGYVNFFSLSILPFLGTISSTNCPPDAPPISIRLNLLDKYSGTGNLVISGFPDADNLIVYDFVAMKKKGKVYKIIGHVNHGVSRNPTCNFPVEGTLPPVLSSLLFGERQFR